MAKKMTATRTINASSLNAANVAALQEIMAELTGYEPTDVVLTFTLEEDLGLDMDRDFPMLIKRVNRHFNINLVVPEIVDAVETVADLVAIIDDETELG